VENADSPRSAILPLDSKAIYERALQALKHDFEIVSIEAGIQMH
jgi:hypothetical protein